MAWTELTARRVRRNKVFQDGNKFALDGHLAALHYESVLDSGVYDTEVNLTPVRVNNASFDGWRVTANGWHYALGIDKVNHPGEDGWIGFGGRRGAHWLKFRLERIGYIHWPTRTRTFLGGLASYTRPGNLTRTTIPLALATTGQLVNVEQVATWANLWTTPGGGTVSARWRASGDGLKEEIIINQAGRDYAASQYPGTPTNETYFCYAFRLDVSDIPKWVRDGILQDIEGDFDDDDGASPVELRDALDRLLAIFPVDDALVRDENGHTIARQRLRKRIFKDGSDYYLVVGARADLLAALPAGDLIFDPTIDKDVAAGGDDGYGPTFNTSYDTIQAGATAASVDAFVRFTAVTVSGTIDVAYLSVYADGLDGTVTNVHLKTFVCDADNPAAPTSQAEFNALARTTAGVDFDPTAWTAGTRYNLTFVTALQELVDTYTISNDAIIVIVDDDGSSAWTRVTFDSYNWGSSQMPKLHIEYTEAGGEEYTQAVAGAITPAGTVVNLAGKVVSGALTSSGALINSARKVLAGGLTPDGALSRMTAKLLAGEITPAGVVATVKTALVSLAGELTSSGALVLQAGKSLAGSITPDGGLVRSIGKILSGVMTPDGALSRMTSKIFSGELTSAGVLGTIKAALMSLGGELTSAGGLVKQAGKAVAGSLTPDGGLSRAISKALSGALTSAGSVVKSIGKTLAGALASAGELATELISGATIYYQAVAGALVPDGGLVRKVNKSLAGILTPAGVVVKKTAITVAGVLSSLGGLVAGLVGLSTPGSVTASEAVVGGSVGSETLMGIATGTDAGVGNVTGTEG